MIGERSGDGPVRVSLYMCLVGDDGSDSRNVNRDGIIKDHRTLMKSRGLFRPQVCVLEPSPSVHDHGREISSLHVESSWFVSREESCTRPHLEGGSLVSLPTLYTRRPNQVPVP